jgi:carbonic anhydrase
MNTIQQCKLSGIVFCFAILPGVSCNNSAKEQRKVPAPTISIEHPHADSVLSDNDVNAEAPDAKTKIEYGYALPKHTAEIAQSPINIISGKAEKAGKEQVSFALHPDISTLENLGHTVAVDFKDESTCVLNGNDYISRQFHFHTPSEHLIDGITFPMEMHIVNILRDSTNLNTSGYLVLAVLFKMGAENKFIKEFMNKISKEKVEKSVSPLSQVRLDDLFSELMENKIKSYYSYKGSLTTPPYTESVQWIILKHVVEASEEQILTLEKLEGNNARHIQAINNRKVYNK